MLSEVDWSLQYMIGPESAARCSPYPPKNNNHNNNNNNNNNNHHHDNDNNNNNNNKNNNKNNKNSNKSNTVENGGSGAIISSTSHHIPACSVGEGVNRSVGIHPEAINIKSSCAWALINCLSCT